MPTPFDWIQTELTALDAASLRRRQREVTPLPEGKCRIAGRTLWNFSGNDYLGLAGDPRLAAAAEEAIRDCGAGARASPLVSGRTPWHARLEERLARFKGHAAALLFPSGYAANVGTICSLAGPEDVVFCDRLNHASLIDGCRLSRARFRVYSHMGPSPNDRARLTKAGVEQPRASVALDVLARELTKAAGARRRLIVTDSVFSMDGDAAPLAELAQLATDHEAMLLVDEAHATGVFGPRGTGLVEALLPMEMATMETPAIGPSTSLPLTSAGVVAVGTLSKAVGSQGGFVTGSRDLIDWLWNTARPQVFSTGLTPAACAAAAQAIEIIEAEPQRRAWLATAAARIRRELRDQGWQVPETVIGPIIPLIVGEAETTLALAAQLDRFGLLIPAIRPPTVPHGTARLRISLSYAHGESGLTALLEAFRQMSPPSG